MDNFVYFCSIKENKTKQTVMRKAIMLMTGAALLLSSCSSYTATGAMMGGEFGHVIGSSIGGITGGWRGHDMGSLIGTVGGVVAGAAIGAAIEQAAERKAQRQREERQPYDNAQGGFDPDMRGDDRITIDDGGPEERERSVSLSQLTKKPDIELRHAAIYDSDHNGVLTRGEECMVTFEVMNNTSAAVYDIYPLVEDVTGNRHVKVSPNLRVESIAPHQGIRYTATILADKRLKDGEIVVRVGVAQGQHTIDSQTLEFRVPTRKK